MNHRVKFLLVCIIIVSIFLPMAVHRPAYKEIWLYVWNKGEYRITDENGNHLLVHDGMTEGTIDIVDTFRFFSSSGPAVWLFRVPEGEAFLLETTEEESYFSAAWDDLFLTFEGSGAAQICITPDSLSVEGTGMDYEISASAGRGKGRSYELRGSGESSLRLNLQENSCVVTATQDCSFWIEKLRELGVYSYTEIPGGTSKEIYDIDQ